ncbi:MAG: ABC transporter ATP-binding protein [Magnetovibrio sp.]|nr:ABC transporter ATP-binding protein [Magnetovibrio sp.]
MSLLRVEGLNKEFGGVHAVQDLSFEINPGTVHAIIGPNGAGKTTLFNLITGVYTPSAGRIHFDDQDVTTLKPYQLAQRGISRTFQNLQIFFNMSAIENVMVGMHLQCDSRFIPSLLRLPSVRRRERELRLEVERLMEFVGLGDYVESDASAMPYGALKRLEIARSLATKPKMILLDEPAAGLNPAETKDIDDLIQKVARSGITVVFVEHDMRLVMGVSDHILVLESGTKLAEGTVQEIRHNPDVVAAYLGEAGRDR